MRVTEKLRIYFGLAPGPDPGDGPVAERSTPAIVVAAVAGGVLGGIVFALLMWAIGEGDLLFKGVLFALFMALFSIGTELRRRRRGGRPTGPPGAGG